MTQEHNDKTGELREQLAMKLAEGILAEITPLAMAFAPHFPQERLGEVAARVAGEQIQIMEQIIPELVSQARQRRQFNVILETAQGQAALFPSLTRLEAAEGDPQLAISTGMLMAFLMQASVRGLLLMHGYRYRFELVATDAKPLVSLT